MFWEQVPDCCEYAQSHLPCSCLCGGPIPAVVLMSLAGFCGLGARSESLLKVQQEPVPLSLKRPAQSLSAASKMSVSAVELCFTVTGIIALNFLCGCYQSVTDTLGKGAL